MMAGWRGYALACLSGALLLGGPVLLMQHWRHDAALARMQRDQAVADRRLVQEALAQTTADIQSMALAARSAAETAPRLTSFIGSLSRALEHASPLPAACRPDAVRVRTLTDAVRAANRAAAGQPVGGSVP